MTPSNVVARRAVAALGAILLMAPAGAQAAERWTTPSATATSGACSALAPCRIDSAINLAAANDEVVVAPGTYSVGTQLKPTVPVNLHGVADQPFPRLVGTSGLALTVLEFRAGGTVRHLRIEATASTQDPLGLQGSVGEQLILESASGDGAKVVGSGSPVVLRDSVVHTAGGGTGAAALKLREGSGGGAVDVRNVTAMAPNGTAYGILCETRTAPSRMVNVVTRGAVGDIDASQNGAQCSAGHSNFRPSLSPGLPVGDANQSTAPAFVDAGGGDYRVQAGSPLINAGASDALLGATDVVGFQRAFGAGPDIGAFEYTVADPPPGAGAPAPGGGGTAPAPAPGSDDTAPGAGTGTDSTTDPASGTRTPGGAPAGLPPELREVPAPQMGRDVVVGPATGTISVRTPNAKGFVTLDAGARIPVGSTIDATRGQVTLVSAIGADRVQAGTFWGSQFEVRQSRTGRGMTDLFLRGGSFAGCRRGAYRARAVASGRRGRHLWGRDRGGRFTTHGRDSVATARGTQWLTEDSCAGTLTRVTEGAVAVRRHGRGRTVLVRAGQSYLARHGR